VLTSKVVFEDNFEICAPRAYGRAWSKEKKEEERTTEKMQDFLSDSRKMVTTT
jgi:hypothetical protein